MTLIHGEQLFRSGKTA